LSESLNILEDSHNYQKMAKKKIWILFVILAVFIVLGTVVLLMNSPKSQNTSNNQNAFSSCQQSTQTIPFVQGESYTIAVLGVANGTCHWLFSLQGANLNQTKDCHYPTAEMSNDVYNHLFGQDKTGTQCSSDVCKLQDALQQNFCK
jgi:ABC-type transport system involved in multi-copper enzyme maturation permease subunit